MRFKIPRIAFLIVLGLALASTAFGVLESANYIIPKDTISSGGSSSTSINYSMTATIGQTSCIGSASSGSFALHAGFWTPEYVLKHKFLPFIPLLLLDD